MENNSNICQSCGMPLQYDPNQGGTNTDNSLSEKYCSYCFANGKFKDDGISLQEKIDKNVQKAVEQMGMDEAKARAMAESILPTLERWKS